jgi:hypothetical protein
VTAPGGVVSRGEVASRPASVGAGAPAVAVVVSDAIHARVAGALPRLMAVWPAPFCRHG